MEPRLQIIAVKVWQRNVGSSLAAKLNAHSACGLQVRKGLTFALQRRCLPVRHLALAAGPLLAQGESVSPAVAPLRCASSQQTRRWRKPDSNFWSVNHSGAD